MREILFRGKCVESGEWVYGYVVSVDDRSRATIFTPLDHSLYDWRALPVLVDPSTICEYTGLVDFDGKKIFENDIVRCKAIASNLEDYWEYAVVKYGRFNCSCCSGVYGWAFESKRGIVDIRDCNEETYCDYDLDGGEYKKTYVVGNVFDNPELLEDDND